MTIASPSAAPPMAPAASRSPAKAERRHDLDWLRVIAIFLLLFYHSGMAFVADWGWHLKNAETSEIFQEWMFFMSRWRMALLFFISGGGTWFVLKRATAGEYVRRRFLRLFVPLAFGIFVVVPPQIYLERVAQGAGYTSYLDFYPSVFAFEPYPKGSTSWHHLWFVAYLFLFSMLGLPIFLWLRSRRALLESMAARATAPLLYALGLPLALILAALLPKFRGPQDLVSDWAMFLYYFTFFALGFLFTMAARCSEVLATSRQTSLRLACLCYATLCYFRWNDKDPAMGYTPESAAYLALLAFNAWLWVLAILGYGRRYLNRSNALLAYANEAIYPFYILHQTVIVIIVYYVIQTEDTVLVKFLFTSFYSFLATMAVYHFLVRPFRTARLLFGMKG
jgi:peptidoglycan/LPS O-acetylase OafA/YrhL